MTALLGRKGTMTQLFDEQGHAVPVTAIEVGSDCFVVRRRTKEHDGYEALQLGFGKANPKRLRKPMAGHFKRAGVPPARFLREVPVEGKGPGARGLESKVPSPESKVQSQEPQASSGQPKAGSGEQEEVRPGQRLTVDSFKPGDVVHVTGRTRGRGFAGGVERWNWSSGPRTHGSMSHRRPGSVGSGASPGRVFRGRHLPGHYGNEQVTIRNLRVVKVEPEAGRLFISGAVPGPRGSLLVVRRVRSGKSER